MVRNLSCGDCVIVPSTIGCGSCGYCRTGYTAQCDEVNPGGSRAGTAFFGGPASTGPFDGLQAGYAVIPHANVPRLVDMVERGSVEPTRITSQVEPMTDVVEAYRQFDLRRPGWIKVQLSTGA